MHNYLNDPKIIVNNGAGFEIKKYECDYTGSFESRKGSRKKLLADKASLHDMQRMMYASDRHSVLLVFQAMDAAGKDSTIRNVFSGMFPQAGQVNSFKAPSKLELDHDYLWRTQLSLPERGKFAIYNRSYYEEVLVTRVHPGYILGQRIPGIEMEEDIDENFWQQRFKSIRDHEDHLAANGTIILKFFLNVSKKEQKRRFLDRIHTQEKNWKFNIGDLGERALWEDYQFAYEEAIKNTASERAPWFVIPADHKWFMRTCVCDIIVGKLQELGLKYPEVGDQEKKELTQALEMLTNE
jgi:PPK2 family polyphosphate:nucleotide phosphotransferase